MNATRSVLPDNWQESGIARHVENPFSPEALAEPVKASLVVPGLDISAFDFGFPVEREAIKEPGDDEIETYGDDGVDAANNLFAEAAREVMGEAVFKAARIVLTYRNSIVQAEAKQRSLPPHVDQWSTKNSMTHLLIGIAFDSIPPRVYQGPYDESRVSSDDRRAGHILGYLGKSAGFSTHLLEENQLHLIAGATIHQPTHAYTTERRKFLRWIAYVRTE